MKVNFVAGLESVQVFEPREGKKGGKRVHCVGQGTRPLLVAARIPENGFFAGVDADKLTEKCRLLAARRALASLTCEYDEWQGKGQYTLLSLEEVKPA